MTQEIRYPIPFQEQVEILWNEIEALREEREEIIKSLKNYLIRKELTEAVSEVK